MTLEIEMALAVIRGEKDTALILAQKLIEEHLGGREEIAPLKSYDAGKGRKKLIFTLDTKLAVEMAVDVNEQGMEEMLVGAQRWLNDEVDALVCIGFIPHLFVMPEPPSEPMRGSAREMEKMVGGSE